MTTAKRAQGPSRPGTGNGGRLSDLLQQWAERNQPDHAHIRRLKIGIFKALRDRD